MIVSINLFSGINVLTAVYITREYYNSSNKKAFQSNANLPLGNNPCFIVNKFEHVWEEGSIYGVCPIR